MERLTNILPPDPQYGSKPALPDLYVTESDNPHQPIRIGVGKEHQDISLHVAEDLIRALKRAIRYRREGKWREAGSPGSSSLAASSTLHSAEKGGNKVFEG